MRSGFCAIVGRPNVGKSTLLNRIVGEKIAAVSRKPQMTRDRIRGIANLDGAQVAFVDTPGVHAARRPLNVHMVRQALAAVAEADVTLLLIDGTGLAKDDQVILDALAEREGCAVAAINKVDEVHDKARLLPLIEELVATGRFAAVVPISALTGDGVDALVAELVQRLPDGPALYPPDQLTDRPVRHFVAELIRERLFELLGQELPYGCAVTIEHWDEPDEAHRTVRILATIHVERASQKGMVIGKGGRTIKQVGTGSRRSIEDILGRRVMLDLKVRVEPHWTRDEKRLRKLGYGER